MAILQQLLQPPGLAFLSTFCLAMTTYFWPYSRSGFDGVLVATLLTCSLFALVTYKNNRKAPFLVLGFTFLGLACITRLTLVLAVPASIVYLAANLRPNARSF
jgi:4-amino-4-deoxy-L-arabinose transferase-like glycosyltransferase